MGVWSPSVSLSLHRSGGVISSRSSKSLSHDERALDATLRDRFRYLLGRAKSQGWDSPKITGHIDQIHNLIAYEFRCKLGGR